MHSTDAPGIHGSSEGQAVAKADLDRQATQSEGELTPETSPEVAR
jgi:hypothetical protein